MDKTFIKGAIKSFLSGIGAPDEAIRGVDLFFSIKWQKPENATSLSMTDIASEMRHYDNHIFRGTDSNGHNFTVFVQSDQGTLPKELLDAIGGGK